MLVAYCFYVEFNRLAKRVKELKNAYDEQARLKGKKEWGVSEYAHGLTGDVGDLLKLLNSYKRGSESRKLSNSLKHELADCLWSLMAIADELDIDIEKEFKINLEYLEQKLKE